MDVSILKISEPTEDNVDFRELSRRFVVESYVWRKVQKAKEENKLVCTDCYTETKQVKFFDVLGIEQHYRRIHHGKKFSLQKSNKLFRELHYAETKTFTDKLSDFRRGNPGHNFKEFCVRSTQLKMNVVAKSKTEAAKLVGLVLVHKGVVRSLGDDGYILGVIEKNDLNDVAQKFNVWKALDKIYVESVYTREVPLVGHSFQLPMQEATIVASAGNGSTDLHAANSSKVNPKTVLKKIFGYDSFRPGQLHGINAVLKQQDAIILIPTGGGKTVIYCVPTMMMKGVTVVISPLLMLMHDQVLRLREKGVNTCFVNSMLTKAVRETVIANISRIDSEYKVLFMSPEVVLKNTTQELLKRLNSEKRLNFFAIDEAHCIDTWGSDLRPEYEELGILKSFGVPVIAVTATATDVTVMKITSTLCLKEPKIVKVPFYSDNLVFEVVLKKPGYAEALKQVAEIIAARFSGLCGIVYCNLREDTSRLALELKKNGITAIFFHGGIIDPELKVKYTNSWLDGKVNVMCATNAFGMGIDKPDVRFVIHLSMPPSNEAYIQESGRAGRDGSEAACILLYRFTDRNFHLRNISNLTCADTQMKRLLALNNFTSYLCEKRTCCQKLVVAYFEDQLEDNCKKCDICQQGVAVEPKNFAIHAKGIVCCIQHMLNFKSRITVEMLSLTYMGSQASDVKKNKFDQVPEYGKGKGVFRVRTISEFIHQMIVYGLLVENLRDITDKSKSTFLTVGNVRELLAGELDFPFG